MNSHVQDYKKIIVGVFAHPDDEAFGPSGYLYMQSQAGVDVHLLLVTDGATGVNNGYDDLAATRHDEWKRAGRIMGVASQNTLGYADGTLSNNNYETICDEIKSHVKKIVESYDEKIKIDFLTLDPNGITGHIDHVFVSSVTTCAYVRLKKECHGCMEIGTLRYSCIPRSFAPEPRMEWLLAPMGRSSDEIDETIDIRSVKDIKRSIMRCHQSQLHDVEAAIAMQDNAESDGDKEFFMYCKL